MELQYLDSYISSGRTFPSVSFHDAIETGETRCYRNWSGRTATSSVNNAKLVSIELPICWFVSPSHPIVKTTPMTPQKPNGAPDISLICRALNRRLTTLGIKLKARNGADRDRSFPLTL